MQCTSESCTKPEWKWDNTTYDRDIYAHVIDQNGPNNSDGIPYQYSTNVADWSQPGSTYWAHPDAIPRCTLVSNTVSGKLSFSAQSPSTDKACVAHTHNAGNYYNFPAATAGSDTHLAANNKPIDAPNSICPKGWQLPPNAGDKSYNTLIHTAYNISDTASDTTLLANSAMSFVRLGYYAYNYGSLHNRGLAGYYWLPTASGATTSRYLYFDSGSLNPQSGGGRAQGFPIRCVSR